MADDQTNPFTVAGMAAMMQPNKYTDPSLQGKPLQLQGYRGTPTDAMGNPIQSFLDTQAQHDAWDKANPAAPAPAQGTTLNSAPGGYGNFSALAPQIFPNDPARQAAYANELGLSTHTPGGGLGGGAPASGGGASAGAGAGAGANPYDMRQAYLDALSNPGKVTTPGASVPQAQPLGSPSVLNTFLAAHPGGGGGPAAGNYTNKPFFDTLNQLRSA